MARFQPHPITAVACTALTGAFFTLTGWVTGPTPEQLEILQHMTLVKLPDGTGREALTIRLSSVNLQLVNGEGSTMTADSTGNLILGYGESLPGLFRTGSHNLVVGPKHSYTHSGGAVFGDTNFLQADNAAILGGSFNQANGPISSVLGGTFNSADGHASSIVAGTGNTATGFSSAVLAGSDNEADGYASAVVGGEFNVASASGSAILGGASGKATGLLSTVGGGSQNEAAALSSTVSGGCGLTNLVECTVLP